MTKEDLENERQRRLRAATRVVIRLAPALSLVRCEIRRAAHDVARELYGRVKKVRSSGGACVAGPLGWALVAWDSTHPDSVIWSFGQACAAVGQSLLMQAYEQVVFCA